MSEKAQFGHSETVMCCNLYELHVITLVSTNGQAYCSNTHREKEIDNEIKMYLHSQSYSVTNNFSVNFWQYKYDTITGWDFKQASFWWLCKIMWKLHIILPLTS